MLTCSCCAPCWFSGSWFFTLSIVSDASTSSKKVSPVNCISPRKRNTKCKVLFFWMLESDSVLSSSTRSVSQILAYFHRENGSFEVLSLHFHRAGTCKHLGTRKATSLFPFNTDSLPFSRLYQYTLFQFFGSVLEDSCPDLLIYMSLHHGIQLLISWHRKILICFLFVHRQHWVDQTLLFASYPNFQKKLSFGTSPVDNKTSSHL